jgi:hypothetical protein
MESESSLLCSQGPATGPYPEPHESRKKNSSCFFKILYLVAM